MALVQKRILFWKYLYPWTRKEACSKRAKT